MKDYKQKVVFFVACIAALVLAWLGFKLFSLGDQAFSSGQFFAAGLTLSFTGIFFASSSPTKTSWVLCLIFLAAGIYLLARAAGVIESALLAFVAGASCIAAAAIIVFVNLPNKAGE